MIIKEAEAKSAEAKAFAAKTPKAKAQADTIAAEKDEVALAAEAREKALKKAEVIVSIESSVRPSLLYTQYVLTRLVY